MSVSWGLVLLITVGTMICPRIPEGRGEGLGGKLVYLRMYFKSPPGGGAVCVCGSDSDSGFYFPRVAGRWKVLRRGWGVWDFSLGGVGCRERGGVQLKSVTKLDRYDRAK